MTDSYPDDNPKTAFGETKVPLHLVPPIAIAHMALAFANGAKKYGPFNWREKTISATVYYAAARRHLDAWFDGEDLAPDSGVHHLAHVEACCAMVLDSQSLGKLNDNRPPKGAFPAMLAATGQTAPHLTKGDGSPLTVGDVLLYAKGPLASVQVALNEQGVKHGVYRG